MNRKRQLSQPSCSGSKTSTKKKQISLEESFNRSGKSVENLDGLVNKCVRFVLYRAGNNLPIRKTELQKSVLPNVGRTFDLIIKKASAILKEVYGYDFYLADEPATTKSYLVTNVLPCLHEVGESKENDEGPPDAYKILIMLTLTHIFMSDNAVTESSLFSFLRSVKIDPEEKHKVFGNVKEFVSITMVKQKYLNKEMDETTKRISYLWGPKAEHEISKLDLLKFVCKVYNISTPNSWAKQLEKAEAQQKSNNENPEESRQENDKNPEKDQREKRSLRSTQ